MTYDKTLSAGRVITRAAEVVRNTGYTKYGWELDCSISFDIGSDQANKMIIHGKALKGKR